jgi:uncharacterized protein Usg
MSAIRPSQDDYRLTTAEIYFHSHQSPDTLQSLTWQDYDVGPDYPELRKFLSYWSRHIDASVDSVQIITDSTPRRGAASYPAPSTAVH